MAQGNRGSTRARLVPSALAGTSGAVLCSSHRLQEPAKPRKLAHAGCKQRTDLFLAQQEGLKGEVEVVLRT